MRLKIGARKSDLARIQAYQVAEALQKAEPELQIDFFFQESLGDKNLTDPLWKMPEKGVFTEDFYQDLISEKIDLVVHSFKDLPTEEREHTEIVATLRRADQRDILLLKKDRVDSIKKTAKLKIFSSSPRRAYNLQEFLPQILPMKVREVQFLNVRGNVPTRVRKLMESADADGLIVAKAALDRLLEAPQAEFQGMQQMLRQNINACLWMVLPLSENPTAAAQGALAIEIKKNRLPLKELMARMNQTSVFANVLEERKILASYGGGCHQKIGVSVLQKNAMRVLALKGLTDAGETLQRYQSIFPESNAGLTGVGKTWPNQTQNPQLFDRVQVACEFTRELQQCELLVSRDFALPPDWQISPSQVVFTSGVQTWKSLAARGVWVNGTLDGLGEDLDGEEMHIETLLGRKPKWLKLTHQDGYSEANSSPCVYSYQLIAKPKSEIASWQGVTHFFWMSGSSFLRALELDPQILQAHHSCGPGNTLKILRQHLPKVSVFLNVQEWQEQTALAKKGQA